MRIRAQDSDTICAVATPPGVGGIGVIRLSGPLSLEILNKVTQNKIKPPESHRAQLVKIFEPVLFETGSSEALIDEAVVTTFLNGKSYTGEDTVEISYHGSPAIAAAILKALTMSGARIADPGEFTYRAVINGKLDLIQAESVLALIESRTEAESKAALRSLKGNLSSTINEIENELTGAIASLEANLDFSEEKLEVESSRSIETKFERIIKKITELIESYRGGKILREGLRVVIMGAPNVGKSSLLNALARENRAIVSSTPGTTRDTVETEINIKGIRATIVDTAGIRESQDEIENEGIARAHAESASADIILRVFEPAALESSDLTNSAISNQPMGPKRITVINKSDLISDSNFKGRFAPDVIFVSAMKGLGIEELKNSIFELYAASQPMSGTPLFQTRQRDLLIEANNNLLRAKDLLITNQSPEFIIFEAQAALLCIFKLLGKTYDDQVMDRVFNEFCIGK